MQHDAEPQESQQHWLVEKQVRYHGKVPSHGGEMRVLYLVCWLRNYPHDRVHDRPSVHITPFLSTGIPATTGYLPQ